MGTVSIVYYVAASVDGYIADADGGVNWLSPFESEGNDGGYEEFYASVDGLMMGNQTYEQILGYGDWPYTGKSCWVFSRRQLSVTRPDVKLTAASPESIMSELLAANLRRVWLVGGGQLASAFRAEGLISEYMITVISIVLGAGIPLFGEEEPAEHLRLIQTKPFSNGIVQLTYDSTGR